MSKTKETNLSKLCRELGWQGGTIYQVSEELTKHCKGCSKEYLEPENLIRSNDAAIRLIVFFYKQGKGA